MKSSMTAALETFLGSPGCSKSLYAATDDERLDALLENLERRAPDVELYSEVDSTENGVESESEPVAGPLADEFSRTCQAIEKLTKRFVRKFGPNQQ